jgi:hypothetical protein
VRSRKPSRRANSSVALEGRPATVDVGTGGNATAENPRKRTSMRAARSACLIPDAGKYLLDPDHYCGSTLRGFADALVRFMRMC